MKKNNKGFTLIELLAVVAILAIVAVLAYNQIANRTSKSKISTIKVNADRYIKAVNDMATMSIKEDVDYEEGTYTVTDLQSTGKIKTTGTLPTGGYVVIENYEVVDACLIYEDKYNVEFENAVAKNVVEDFVCLTDSDLTKEFAYTGSYQTFKAPYKGKYKIELWGAQGGSLDDTTTGGYGGYSVAEIQLDKGDTLYVNVGEAGKKYESYTLNNGTYNGGGGCTYEDGNWMGGSGGGATTISTVAPDAPTLEYYTYKYSSIYYNSRIMVAGGGGGAIGGLFTMRGGNAGGISSEGLTGFSNGSSVYGASQTAPGYNSSQASATIGGFGPGGRGYYGAGGGAGYYGGGGGYGSSSTGGTGYIGNSNLTNKAMYCYDCTESSDEDTKTVSTDCVSLTPKARCAKKGDGYAIISMTL